MSRCDSRADIPLMCFSHLRWNFVWQRPQQLMSRFAARRPVLFIEERIPGAGPLRLEVRTTAEGVVVVEPHGEDCPDWNRQLEAALRELLARFGVKEHLSWYFTPMALSFSRSVRATVTIYDCMDELRAFAFAPPQLGELEDELFRRAQLVFTGGQSLYESKRRYHRSVHCFPSSVDTAHFRQALRARIDPPDQAALGKPRIGYYGVLDERLDLELIDGVAAARPGWSFIMLGPTVKVSPSVLPRRDNIHYLGIKSYDQLPDYLAHWDVAMLPFAHNDATRFVSPTKTPEYLAAGCPVISVSIRDVVRPYGEQGMVAIADGASSFVSGIERLLMSAITPEQRSLQLERFLRGTSWDTTVSKMDRLILDVMEAERADRRTDRKVQLRGIPGQDTLSPEGPDLFERL